MSVEENNKDLIRDYIETWNRGDLEELSRFWARDVVHHTRNASQGLTAAKAVVAGFMQAFPDLHFVIEDLVAEGDKVATRMTATGTHDKPYMGVSATGRQINCSLMGVVRLRNGKIVEHWGVTDELALMQQIGLLPDEYLAAMA